jgi:hypothetical protein
MRNPSLAIRRLPSHAAASGIAAALISLCACASAQSVSTPTASYIDVQQRHEQLAHNKDPRIASAIASLASCTSLPEVQPPTGRMNIPHHYLNGSHGPTNPEEAKATRVYYSFERRITAGMNQWLVTSSKEEAQCAQQQIDAWAKAATLLDYDPKDSSQAWFQVEWTLSSIAISESVLVNEPSLDPVQVKRDIQWMNKVAHRTIDFDKASNQTNNHHYWRGLAAVSTGVISSDNELFDWGVGVYKQAINELEWHAMSEPFTISPSPCNLSFRSPISPNASTSPFINIGPPQVAPSTMLLTSWAKPSQIRRSSRLTHLTRKCTTTKRKTSSTSLSSTRTTVVDGYTPGPSNK